MLSCAPTKPPASAYLGRRSGPRPHISWRRNWNPAPEDSPDNPAGAFSDVRRRSGSLSEWGPRGHVLQSFQTLKMRGGLTDAVS